MVPANESELLEHLAVGVLVPLQFVGLLGWWFYQAWGWSSGETLSERQRKHPFIFGWPILVRLLWRREIR